MYKILWADDEIDLLKPHLIFLQQKGYEVSPVNSGADALDQFSESDYDVVFLDENMPGLGGLEVLEEMKKLKPAVPVIMITKNEEEHIMEEAIGAKIADYLIKPLNPNQILLSVKKILDNRRIISEKTNRDYQMEFMAFTDAVQDADSFDEWVKIYNQFIFWEMEMEAAGNDGMLEVLGNQRNEANLIFSRFIKARYQEWIGGAEDGPVLSHQLLDRWVLDHLGDEPLFLIVIDNLRLDQWKAISSILNALFTIRNEKSYLSILPTATAYARNAIFSGLTPLEMAETHPDLWVGETDDEGKNNHEEEFLAAHLKRKKIDKKISYHKIKNLAQGRQIADNIHNLTSHHLNVIVYNFVDMLSHARTEMEVIKELAPTEAAYRSLTRSWFSHSPLYAILRNIAHAGHKVIITTDHGTTRVDKPSLVKGDRTTNDNIRYKVGKSLGFETTTAFHVPDPKALKLPSSNLSDSFLFAAEREYFIYPNNYNHYVKYFRDTFQHGGISMEEMIVPFIVLEPR